MQILIRIDNVFSKVITPLSDEVKDALRKLMSYEVKGAFFSPKFKDRVWDGRKYFFTLKTQVFPTGLASYVINSLTNAYNYEVVIEDLRQFPSIGESISLRNINLRDYQQDILKMMLECHRGVIRAPTGSGKSISIAAFLGEVNIPSLILVHRKSIALQLKKEFEDVLGIEFGFIGAGRFELKEKNVGLIQTVCKAYDIKVEKELEGDETTINRLELQNYIEKVPCVIVDECLPGKTFIRLFNNIEVRLKEIVEKQQVKEILSYNENLKIFESKKIIRYIKLPKNNFYYYELHCKYEDKEYVVRCTGNHKVWTSNGYKCANELNIKDVIKLYVRPKKFQCSICSKLYSTWQERKACSSKHQMRNRSIKLSKMRKENPEIYKFLFNHDLKIIEIKKVHCKTRTFVYNLEVEDNHNYIANNFLVSNCHHTPTDSYLEVLKQCKNTFFRFGFSATPARDDMADLAIEAQTGRRIIDISASKLIKEGYLSKPIITFLYCKHEKQPSNIHYGQLYKQEIVNNEKRNRLVVDKAVEKFNEDKTILIAVTYIEHGKILLEMLRKQLPEDLVQFANGTNPTEELEQKLQDLRDRKIKVCVATTVFGEGVNVPNLNCLITAKSQRSSVNALQLVGRVLRKTETKDRVEIFDIWDTGCRYFKSHCKDRLKIYQSEPLFEVVLPKEVKE